MYGITLKKNDKGVFTSSLANHLTIFLRSKWCSVDAIQFQLALGHTPVLLFECCPNRLRPDSESGFCLLWGCYYSARALRTRFFSACRADETRSGSNVHISSILQ